MTAGLTKSASKMLLALIGALLATLASWSDAPAQAGERDRRLVVSGVVTDSAGRAVAGAQIHVVGDSAFATTDQRGRFRLPLSPGSHVLRVRGIGFRSVVLSVVVDSSRTRVEPLVMASLDAAGAVRLPEIAVEAESPPEYLTRAIDRGFLDRRRLGFGSFLTRDQFDRYLPVYTADILRNIPGVRVVYGMGGPRVSFSRCSRGVGVWVNGVRIRVPDHNAALGLVHPDEVAAIEVYRSVAQIPAEYHEGSCAAIVIWTL